MARSKRLTGLDPLAYLGVEPMSPLQFVINNTNDPNSNNTNFNIGTIWLNISTDSIFMLTSLSANVATWTPLNGGGGGALDSITAGNAVQVFGDAGNNITLVNGPNIQTIGNSGAHTITVQVTSSITIPGDFTTTAGNVNLPQTVDATEGNITFDGDVYLHQYGTNNFFVGESAGNYTTSGDLNVSLGASSLLSLTGGAANTSLGQFSGVALSSGNDNTFIGYNAGNSQTTASRNVFVGSQSGELALDTPQNVCIGYFAGRNLNSGGGNNICIGFNSGNSLADGADNVLIGAQAGSSLTTGDDSHIFIGTLAGQNATGMGSPTIGIGYQAGESLTSGSSNTFIGYQSGRLVTTSGGNTFIGYQTGLVLTTGAANTLVGTLAGSSLTTGTTNTFIGNQAGLSATTPMGNVAVGYQAGRSMTTAQANCFVGLGAGAAITTGGSNTFIGDSAGGFGITTGVDNICVGVNAGLSIGASSNSNIYIGNVGASENTTIRIGDEGTQTACYIAGINGNAVSNTRTVVIDGTTGQLGVGSSSPGVAGDNAFFATRASTSGGTIPIATTPYYAGSTAVYTVVSDVDSVFYPGDGIGAPATFTVPATGLYQLTFNFQGRGNLVSAVTVTGLTLTFVINGDPVNTAYCKRIASFSSAGATTAVVSETLTGLFAFTSGDVITFGISWFGSAALNFNEGDNFIPSSVTGLSNWISGYRVS